MTFFIISDTNQKIQLPNFILNHCSLFRLYNTQQNINTNVELPIPFNKKCIELFIKAFKKKYILKDIVDDIKLFDHFMKMLDFIDCPLLFNKYISCYKKHKFIFLNCNNVKYK